MSREAISASLTPRSDAPHSFALETARLQYAVDRPGFERTQQVTRRHDDELMVEKLVAYLRAEQRVWVNGCSDQQLRQRVHWGLCRARSHGVTWESSLMKFVGLMFRIAPNFDEFPAVAEVLSSNRASPNELVDLLFIEVTPTQWEAAMACYDPSAWEFEE